jgi:hypothetical protein
VRFLSRAPVLNWPGIAFWSSQPDFMRSVGTNSVLFGIVMVRRRAGRSPSLSPAASRQASLLAAGMLRLPSHHHILGRTPSRPATAT